MSNLNDGGVAASKHKNFNTGGDLIAARCGRYFYVQIIGRNASYHYVEHSI